MKALVLAWLFVNALVSLMNGNIDVQSEPGVGSTFIFNVDLQVADESECDFEDSTPHAIPAANTRILLAAG